MADKIDGQAEALRLLRCLQKLNWDHERPSGSARLVHQTLRSLNKYPESERLRFAHVISDRLVEDVLELDLAKYEAWLTTQTNLKQGMADPQFQRFLGKLKLDQRPTA